MNAWVAAATVEPPRSSVRPAVPVLAAAALAGGCLYVGLVSPSSGPYPACPFHTITGLWCPGCGSSRAAHSLLNGHLGAAFGFNALMVLALPLVTYSYLAWALPAAGGPRLPALRAPAWLVWTVLGVVVVFGVLRNVPVDVLRALAP